MNLCTWVYLLEHIECKKFCMLSTIRKWFFSFSSINWPQEKSFLMNLGYLIFNSHLISLKLFFYVLTCQWILGCLKDHFPSHIVLGIMTTGAINVVRGSRSSVEELLQIYSHSERFGKFLPLRTSSGYFKTSTPYLNKFAIFKLGVAYTDRLCVAH